ncbi:uncharacterized protein LOC141714281 [Apium graveolens]|uniref:uncharacterized protein LOC141714281 n=1 Tax=Apium graveolens TaxID=4045 RepID=UPI003D79006B
MGDFNDLLYSTYKVGVHPHPRHLMEGFRQALEESMLAEIDLSGGLYTWEKGRNTGELVQERLDRAFATKEWWSKFPFCKLTVHTTPVSDHDAIHLELMEVVIAKKVFRFKFENTWFKEENFIRDVTKHWESIPPSHLLLKLMTISRYMEKWGRNFFNKFKEKLRMQKELLNSLKFKSDAESIK